MNSELCVLKKGSEPIIRLTVCTTSGKSLPNPALEQTLLEKRNTRKSMRELQDKTERHKRGDVIKNFLIAECLIRTRRSFKALVADEQGQSSRKFFLLLIVRPYLNWSPVASYGRFIESSPTYILSLHNTYAVHAEDVSGKREICRNALCLVKVSAQICRVQCWYQPVPQVQCTRRPW